MSSLFSEYLDFEMDGLEDNSDTQSATLPPAAFGTSPGMDHILMFGSTGDQSPLLSPINSPLEVGSAPITYPMLDSQTTMSPSMLYKDTSSHSFPGAHLRGAPHQSTTSFPGPRHGDDSVWLEEVFMRTDPHEHYTHQPAMLEPKSAYTFSDLDPNHVPHGWLSSTGSAMNRTESVFSHNSIESFTTTGSFEDFFIGDTFTNTHPNAESLPSIINELTSIDSSWSTQESCDTEVEDAPTPKATGKPSKPGRKGVLTQEQKDHAARIRKIKACATCRKRRAKCDDGIPCSTCKKYFRKDPGWLVDNPCRGESLKELADLILDTNAFPKGPYTRFLRPNMSVEPIDWRIQLDLGFGHVPFKCRIKLVRNTGHSPNRSAFHHTHVDYPWPPTAGNSVKNVGDDMVFPAILADDQQTIASQVEAHLSRVLVDKSQFQYFPVWFSELKVLRLFYKYFLMLPPASRNPLQQAFQILILIHVGGNVRLLRQDPVIARINNEYFPGVPHERISPCFVRAQLGPIFSQVAHKLMSEVLKQLERLSALQDPAHFPMVISTFSVLFMALESLQYHFAKIAYHSHNDSSGHGHDVEPPTRDLSNFEGADILLRFYQSTSCHEQLGTLVDLNPIPDLSSPTRSRSRAGSSASARRYSSSCPAANNHGALDFLKSLSHALREAGDYVKKKDLMSPTVPTSDMSCFFDRLLAKMYRLPCVT